MFRISNLWSADCGRMRRLWYSRCRMSHLASSNPDWGGQLMSDMRRARVAKDVTHKLKRVRVAMDQQKHPMCQAAPRHHRTTTYPDCPQSSSIPGLARGRAAAALGARESARRAEGKRGTRAHCDIQAIAHLSIPIQCAWKEVRALLDMPALPLSATPRLPPIPSTHTGPEPGQNAPPTPRSAGQPPQTQSPAIAGAATGRARAGWCSAGAAASSPTVPGQGWPHTSARRKRVGGFE